MAAPLAAAAIMAGGSIAGGMMGSRAAKKAAAQEAEFRQRALAELEAVGIPTIDAQKIILETPELVFQFAPQLESDFPEIKSKFESIEIDPRLRAAQMDALTGLEERASMGLTPEEQAQLNSLRRDVGQQEKARQQSILQNMEQRGIGGSGAELAAQLSSSQASTQRAAEESDRLASMQFAAKQQALQNMLSGASQIRGQEFGEQAKQASALDAISQFNAAQRADTQRRNIERQNMAELERQRLGQNLEGQRAQTSNVQEQYNKSLIQQDFENRMQKAQAKAAALTGAGQAAARSGAVQASNIANIGTGAGQLAGAGYQAYSENKAQDDKDFNDEYFEA